MSESPLIAFDYTYFFLGLFKGSLVNFSLIRRYDIATFQKSIEINPQTQAITVTRAFKTFLIVDFFLYPEKNAISP